MPEGDPSLLPAMPKFVNGWQLGEPDLVVKMTEGYTLYAEGPDIYRNFVVPLNFTEDKWVTAIEFRPGVRSIVHHSLFFYDTTGQAMEQDAADPVPGFRRMRQGGIRNGRLGGWAVGGVPRMLPEGLAYKLPKDADLILSTHFHPSGKEEKETSTIGLYFSDRPPKQGFTAIQLPPAFGALADVDIPAGEKHYSKKDFFVLPVDVKAFGVSAHAHYLGKSMRMSATLPDGNKKQLLIFRTGIFPGRSSTSIRIMLCCPKAHGSMPRWSGIIRMRISTIRIFRPKESGGVGNLTMRWEV